MKRIIVLLLTGVSLIAEAQNLQLHYDFGKDRKFFTATLEMFKPDTLGSTFWFVDFDHNFPGKPRSMSAAYWEISREFYIPGLRNIQAFRQLAFHIEYDDGFTAYKDTTGTMAAASYNSILLAGFSHPVRIGNVTVSTQWLCRMPRGMDIPDFQFTVVWYQSIFKDKLLITGYADFYSQDKILDPDKKELVFQTEPQFWYKVIPKIAFGSEIEISKNFPVGPADWKVSPTLAVRWEF